MPDQVRHDEFGLFKKLSKLHYQSFFAIKQVSSATSGWADT
jgi:hypothetical protein